MGEMKFKFTIQPYQTEAVDSVVRTFEGQPYNDLFTYRRDMPLSMKGSLFDNDKTIDEILMGYGNAAIRLDNNQLLANINRI